MSYLPSKMFRRTPAERADQMLSWQRSDQAFFAAGACRGNARGTTSPATSRRRPYIEKVAVDLISRFPVGDDDLSALHARAFGGEIKVTPWRERLQRHALTWVGAFDSGRLVGFVQACWDGGEHAFLLDTAVDPRWQHTGIGRRLVVAAAADAAAAGCQWLHVDFEPQYEQFYVTKCGFTPTRAGLLRLDRLA